MSDFAAVLIHTLSNERFLLYLIGIMNPHICCLTIEILLLFGDFFQFGRQRCHQFLSILLLCLQFIHLNRQLLPELPDLFLLRFDLGRLPINILNGFCMLTTALINLFQTQTHRILMECKPGFFSCIFLHGCFITVFVWLQLIDLLFQRGTLFAKCLHMFLQFFHFTMPAKKVACILIGTTG